MTPTESGKKESPEVVERAKDILQYNFLIHRHADGSECIKKEQFGKLISLIAAALEAFAQERVWKLLRAHPLDAKCCDACTHTGWASAVEACAEILDEHACQHVSLIEALRPPTEKEKP